MTKIFSYFILILIAISCNQKTIEIPMSKVGIIPNPFINQAQLYIPNELLGTDLNIKILDGKKIIHEFNNINQNNFLIEMTDYPEGVYHLETSLNGETTTEPILKLDK